MPAPHTSALLLDNPCPDESMLPDLAFYAGGQAEPAHCGPSLVALVELAVPVTRNRHRCVSENEPRFLLSRLEDYYE